jgi:hypothetical protein
LYVLKTSSAREREYLGMISKFLPLMESISASMDNVNVSMLNISARLENIEGSQLAFMPRAECKILDSIGAKVGAIDQKREEGGISD